MNIRIHSACKDAIHRVSKAHRLRFVASQRHTDLAILHSQTRWIASLQASVESLQTFIYFYVNVRCCIVKLCVLGTIFCRAESACLFYFSCTRARIKRINLSWFPPPMCRINALPAPNRYGAGGVRQRSGHRSRVCRMGMLRGVRTAQKAKFLSVGMQKDRILLFFG